MVSEHPTVLLHLRDSLTEIAATHDLTQQEIDDLEAASAIIGKLIPKKAIMPTREQIEEFVANFAPADPPEVEERKWTVTERRGGGEEDIIHEFDNPDDARRFADKLYHEMLGRPGDRRGGIG